MPAEILASRDNKQTFIIIIIIDLDLFCALLFRALRSIQHLDLMLTIAAWWCLD